MLVSPHLTSNAHSSLSLVHNERNVEFRSDLPELLVVTRSCHLVVENSDGLNYNGSYILLPVSALLNDLSGLLDASVLFSIVFVLEVCKGILKLRERGNWPVEGRDLLQVDVRITAGESGD